MNKGLLLLLLFGALWCTTCVDASDLSNVKTAFKQAWTMYSAAMRLYNKKLKYGNTDPTKLVECEWGGGGMKPTRFDCFLKNGLSLISRDYVRLMDWVEEPQQKKDGHPGDPKPIVYKGHYAVDKRGYYGNIFATEGDYKLNFHVRIRNFGGKVAVKSNKLLKMLLSRLLE